jgi:PAS domain S-box-containing protein
MPGNRERVDSAEDDPRLRSMFVQSLSMEHIRDALAGHFDAWVRAGIGVALTGYALSTVAHLSVGGSVADWLWTFELPAVVLLLGTWVLAQRGQPLVAVQLALVTVWAQLVGTLLWQPEGVRGIGGPVLVLLVLAVNLLLGPSWALAACAVSSVTVPAVLLAGPLWFPQARGLPLADLHLVVSLIVTLWGTAVLQTLFLRSFWTLIRRVRTNEARFAAMVEGSPDAVVGLGPDGCIDTFNTAAERALGVSAEDVMGKPFSALPLRSVGGSPLETHTGPRELEVVGREVVLESMVLRIAGPERSLRLLMVLRDVTARRRAETRAQELKEQLEHAQRLEAVGRLAGGVAHDFNNLLTAIGGGAAFLQDHDDEEVREIATELRSAQERGAALTRQLLSFARKEVRSPKVLDLAVFLERERSLLQRIIGERVVLDLDPSGPAPVLLDEGQLEQVLLNLAVNSRDAMPDGGTLYVGCRAEGTDSVSLTVRDTGIGMSDEVRRHLFEPFFTTKGMDGTGLGLSTVHGIVTNSAGSIDVVTGAGQGAEFRIRLPRAQAPLPARPAVVSEKAKSGSRILLVEDDDLTRDFARRALVRMGHAVEVARNGAEALDRIGREAPFELVLSDVTMPVMTGPELLERIRDQGLTVPVLLMSGYVDDVLREGTYDVTTQLLLKPFSMDELSRRVSEAILNGTPENAVGRRRDTRRT